MNEHNLRIFAGRGPRGARRLVRPSRDAGVAPAAACAGAETPPAAAVAAADPQAELDRRILEILEAPPAWGETVDAAFRRKEQALREIFAALSSVEAGQLHHRLAASPPEDRVAACLLRLVPDRRARLLAYLAEIPRRAAMAKVRRA